MARSPSYPQVSLPKAIELVREVYAGAHKSAIDSETVIELLGYSSRSGRALAVVGALKQFGLLEGREDNIRVTSLALSILEPLTEKERTDSLRQAAFQPDLFSELLREFGESAPSEAVIRSIAIRKYIMQQEHWLKIIQQIIHHQFKYLVLRGVLQLLLIQIVNP